MSFDAWMTCPHPRPDARLRLLCFPFAGGAASAYRTWWQELPADVEVRPIQLPGREERRREQPFARLTPLVRALADAVAPRLAPPFAFFGHSLGALVAFELARELRRRRAPLPVHMFVSGRRAPHLPLPEPLIHRLPEPQLLAAIRRFGGTPDAVLREPELMAMVLPIVRADFGVNEGEPFVREEPLSCPITAYSGLSDEHATVADVDAWREHTTGAFSRETFPGGHFFPATAKSALLRSLGQALGASRASIM